MVITCTTCNTKHVMDLPTNVIWIKCPVGGEQAKQSHSHDSCVLCELQGFEVPVTEVQINAKTESA